MRMLPDNPSVDFLRREAKDLLAALREREPRTTLSDAQQVLAHAYGARGWADLRSEVDRRRADLPTPEPGMAEALADAFGLGLPTRPMTAISYQHMGRTWGLETDRGRWLVSPVFSYIDDAQAAVAVDLMERAADAGVRTPRPVRDPEGHLVRVVGGQTWRVDAWLELGPTPVRPVRSATARRVGQILATVHGFGIPTDDHITPYLSCRREATAWDELLERARAAGRPWAGDLERLRTSFDELDQVDDDGRESTDRIISMCDFVPEAARYGPGDDLVVTHWSFAGPHVPELELGYVLMQWAVYGGVNPLAARSLLDGYRDRAGAVPALDLSSFAIGIGGYLKWTYNAMCESIQSAGTEKSAFADLAVREVIDDPLTVGKLEDLLRSLPALAG